MHVTCDTKKQVSEVSETLVCRSSTHFNDIWIIKLKGVGVWSDVAIKGVVCDSNPKHFLSNSANISSRSASCLLCACAEKESGVYTQSAQDNSLDNSEFDHGIICVYCEYSPFHL